ncbi:hypothetical protein RclHR1_04810006 [Rhizophagus clarus]|uniref:Uncharacterized protein n=1 Tax=Rhizophagus clarus TaxID=94130 RepID=A0A2Z6RWK5_9GLOM|nr:hypothetical protein RclHR1_04810006 [Rhizophagus clarus]
MLNRLTFKINKNIFFLFSQKCGFKKDCGCQKFWQKPDSDANICGCEHHETFHEQKPTGDNNFHSKKRKCFMGTVDRSKTVTKNHIYSRQ